MMPQAAAAGACGEAACAPPIPAAMPPKIRVTNNHGASAARELVSAGTEALTRINRIASMTMGFFFEKDTPGPVHVCEMAEEVIDTLSAVDRFKQIDLVRDFKCNPVIVASPPRIRQLFASLLTNAMESSATAVRVRVCMAPDWRYRGRNGVRLTVADDGRGIQNELRERIFEPFFSTKAEKATGLGLWASRAIVLRNDGRIKIRSAVAGSRRGTCISVFLPTYSETPAVAANSKHAVGSGN